MVEKFVLFWIIDIYVGVGWYVLELGYVIKLVEFKDGVGCLWDKKGLLLVVVDYFEFVKMFNFDGKFCNYFGLLWLVS